ncbi:MAG: hypothetical protein ACI8TQ_002381 [Planctomycetota bacterium]|jgi:hypothetical protein
MIYNALTQMDASMRVMQLEAEGIEVVTKGGTTTVGWPEVPAPEVFEVQIWVPNANSARAAEIMIAFDKERGQTGGEEWTCACGEVNEANYQICWSCEKDRVAS